MYTVSCESPPTAMSDHLLREQIDKNYEAFSKRLPELLILHRGKFALMKDEQIVEFFDTARDAHAAGTKLYPDGLFSVQEVVPAASRS